MAQLTRTPTHNNNNNNNNSNKQEIMCRDTKNMEHEML